MSSAEGEIAKRMERLFAGGTVSGLSERELLQRFSTGRDEAAFEAIAARHGPMILAVCRRVLDDPRDVEDSFQAVFLVLVRKAARLRDADRLGPWLHAVATKVALRARSNAWKRRRREISSQAILDAAASGGGNGVNAPEHVEADWRDLRPVLDEELARLPEKYRAPIVLCHLEGLTHDQAAARLKWPVGTVRGRLARGRETLRARLTRRGLAFSTALISSLLAERAAPASTVSDALLSSTFQSLSRVAVSAAAVTLAEGVLSTMFMTKVRVVLTGILAVGVLSTGAAVFGRQRIREDSPDKASEKIVTKDEQPQSKNDRKKEILGDDREETRFDKLGEEADTLRAEIEVLQIEVDNIRQRLQQTVQTRGLISGGGGFGGMMGGMGGGNSSGVMPKPKNEEEKKAQDEERAEFERQQAEAKRQQEKQQEETRIKYERLYEQLRKDFLAKSVKLGGMRRRLEKIQEELSVKQKPVDTSAPNDGNATRTPRRGTRAPTRKTETSTDEKPATAADMDVNHRLNVIERKMDELKEKFDGSRMNNVQQKLDQILNKVDALKK